MVGWLVAEELLFSIWRCAECVQMTLCKLEWKQSSSQHDDIMTSSSSQVVKLHLMSIESLPYITPNWSQGLVQQFLRTLKGGPCPGMMTSAVRSASWRLTSCTVVFILRSRQLSSSEQHSNKSPATTTVPTEVPFTWTLTSCPVWPGLGTTDICRRREIV